MDVYTEQQKLHNTYCCLNKQIINLIQYAAHMFAEQLSPENMQKLGKG